MSLQLGRVPTLWKTSCIVPVPKQNQPSELNDFQPVALKSPLMKTLEQLVLNLLRYMYSTSYSLLTKQRSVDKGSGTVRILFLDFLSAFNTIQPPLLQDKLIRMQVDPCLVTWISSYLTNRPQYVRLKDITYDTVVSNTGAPQGTMLSPLLFALYTADFCYNPETCHIQKFADDTAIMGCIRDDEEEEYRSLQLNTSNTKELVIDFGRNRPRPRLVLLGAEEVEVMETYKYLGLWLDNKLDWTSNTKQLYKTTQSKMYFLRRLQSFSICKKLLWMFYQSVLSYTVVCWGGSTSQAELSRLEKLVRRATSVVGMKLDPLMTAAERGTLKKQRGILDNANHPLYTVISSQRSRFCSSQRAGQTD